jgi:hypothetical protein
MPQQYARRVPRETSSGLGATSHIGTLQVSHNGAG